VNDEQVYLTHILDAINDIKEYASVGEAVFLTDRMRQDAIIRKLEIVGEAVKRLPDHTRARRPEIPWKQIAGMRDRLTHAYFGVDLGLVWRVVERPSSSRGRGSCDGRENAGRYGRNRQWPSWVGDRANTIR
jgi:uncharacterized protein with HEPN domain